jgi:hypothetical protein
MLPTPSTYTLLCGNCRKPPKGPLTSIFNQGLVCESCASRLKPRKRISRQTQNQVLRQTSCVYDAVRHDSSVSGTFVCSIGTRYPVPSEYTKESCTPRGTTSVFNAEAAYADPHGFKTALDAVDGVKRPRGWAVDLVDKGLADIPPTRWHGHFGLRLCSTNKSLMINRI